MSTFEEKVKEEIMKTGLPTEIKVTKTLKKAGWRVFNEYPYFDSEKNKIRTLDLTAEKFFSKSDGSTKIDSSCELYIECKKSSSQSWVFYTEDAPSSYLDFSISRLVHDMTYRTFNLVLEAYQKTNPDLNVDKEHVTIFGKIPVRFQNIKYKIALSQQSVFKEKKVFYEGKMQLLKALRHKNEEDKAKPSETSSSVKVIPIIVFDGHIFECYYDDKGELNTPKIEYTRYLAHGLPNQRLPALIDVMTLHYFPKYLKLIEKEFSNS